jgi:hypothetical protein
MWRGQRPQAPPSDVKGPPPRAVFSGGHKKPAEASTRPSRGLDEFFTYIRGQSGLTILDLGGATQQNVSFITNLGHRLYSENFLQLLGETFGGEGSADQSNAGRIEYFLRQALDYPQHHFGVLIWDFLEYLEPALLTAVVERLHKIVRPKSYMLAFFHSDNKLEAVPYYTFRIQEVNLLHVTQHGSRHPTQLFNNRSLEKLFANFESPDLADQPLRLGAHLLRRAERQHALNAQSAARPETPLRRTGVTRVERGAQPGRPPSHAAILHSEIVMTVKVSAKVASAAELPLGVVTRTTRVPALAEVAMATVAVNLVPSGVTWILLTVKAESAGPAATGPTEADLPLPP